MVTATSQPTWGGTADGTVSASEPTRDNLKQDVSHLQAGG